MFCFAFFNSLLFIYRQLSLSNSELWDFQVEGESSQTENESSRTHSHTGWLNRRWPVPMAGPGREGHSAWQSTPAVLCSQAHTKSPSSLVKQSLAWPLHLHLQNISILLRLIVSVDTHKKIPFA